MLGERFPLHRIKGTIKCYPWPLANVWLGVSAEDQPRADERIPLLLQCPAAVRFVSLEPLLGPIDIVHKLGDVCTECSRKPQLHAQTECPSGYLRRGVDWVIVGGESGPGARPCDVEWIRSIVRRCKAAGVACFVKQLGATIRVPDSEPIGDVESGWSPFARACVSDDNLIRLATLKGGDPEEWPHDLRVREWPQRSAQPGVRERRSPVPRHRRR